MLSRPLVINFKSKKSIYINFERVEVILKINISQIIRFIVKIYCINGFLSIKLRLKLIKIMSFVILEYSI